MQVSFALLAVLLAIFATAWILRRLGAGQVGKGGQIRLVAGVAVGPKERVVIVEVKDTWLVLGVTAAEITQLHHLPKPEEETAAEPATGRFAERLREALRPRKPQEEV